MKFKVGDIIFYIENNLDIMKVIEIHPLDEDDTYLVEQLNDCDDYQKGEINWFSKDLIESYTLLTEQNKALFL